MLRLIDINGKTPSNPKFLDMAGQKAVGSHTETMAPSTRLRAPENDTSSLSYNLKSVWLFTYSDLKTIIFPSTLFATLHLLASKSLGFENSSTPLFTSITRALFWTWINLLPFAIDNQRQPEAIQEDGLNKAWRPFPSRRMSPETGRNLMFVFYFLAVMASFSLNGLQQCISLICLGYAYNDLGAADRSCIVRNLVNGLGFVCYTSGALQVALGSDLHWDSRLVGWFAIIGSVVFSTVQTQDMYDQPGDSERGRATVPLVIGDGVARWTIAVPMVFWSLFCPWYWSVAFTGLGLFSTVVGGLVAGRTLTRRSIAQDKVTFIIWNAWMVSLYSLPLAASML